MMKLKLRPSSFRAGVFLLSFLFIACSSGDDQSAPTVSSTVPTDSALDVPLGGAIAVTFSEPMDPQTLNATTLTLMQGTTAIEGIVSYTGVTATFKSTAALEAKTVYTATVTTGARDLTGNALAEAYTWSFTTGSSVDMTAPSVSSAVPLNEAVDVALGGAISVTFSEAMDPATISSVTLVLMQGATPVEGVVTYAGVTATFTPTEDLVADTAFMATVTTGALDLAGNALDADYVWGFTTGSALDTTPPTVSSTVPAAAANDVALDAGVAVTFSEAMDPLTVSSATVTLMQGTTLIPASVTFTGVVATLNPTDVLTANTTYTALITVGVKDLAGNAMATPHTLNFTTGFGPDTTAPTVFSTLPAAGELAVAINRNVSISFSEAMNPTTLSTATFTVTGPGAAVVTGVVLFAGTQAVFNPASDLAPNTLFEAKVTTGAEDLAGNALESDFTWSFTTSAELYLGPDPVLLGMAGDYVILAKSGVDTVPTSAVIGNVGVSPITSTAVTGFSLTLDATNLFATSSQITGQVRAPDYAAPTPSNLTTAVGNMETAYTDAAGRSIPDFSELGAGEIGGLTLEPGLYKWGTGVSISTSVVLDGGPNDVWIFQIAGNLTQANGTLVTLTGGALPKNVFWQSFGQVVIGTTAHFEGVVLCQTAIILGTGASVNGRLLAQTSVTLDQNAVTQPAP